MQIAIVVYPGMTALDALGPYELLHGLKDVELRLVWKEVGPIVTDSNVLVIGATHSFAETPRPDVVLVGGSSASTIATMTDRAVLDWLRAVHPHTRFTTSVCSGAMILAGAGLLEERAATTHWAAMPLLAQFGVQARPDARVVRDGKLWTAAGVSAGLDLALALIAELKDPETAQVAQLMIEYDPQPPFDAGHMSKASESVKKRARREMALLSAAPRELLALPQALAARWLQVLVRKVRGGRAPTAPA